MPEPLKSTGLTVGFGTDPAMQVTAYQPVGCEVVNVDTSHLAGTIHTQVPGTMIKFTPAVITVQLDPDKDYQTYVGVSQTVTVTFGKFSSGSSSGATHIWTGYIGNISPASAGIDEILSATFTVECTGDVAFTPEA